MRHRDRNAAGRRLSIERMETRLLFSGPTAALDPQQAVPAAGTHTYAFTVDYTDSAAVDLSTLGNDNVTVTGPNSFSQPGQFVSSASANGVTEASYSVSFAGIGLTDFNNGTYTVTQVAYNPASGAGVADATGAGFPATTIGTFAVNLPVAPQLQLTNPVFTPGTYPDGAPVSFRATVTNGGDAAAPSFTLAVALSPTAQFAGGSVIILGNATIDQSLSPGQSMVVSVPGAVIPASTAVGGYYIGAQINYASGSITPNVGSFTSPNPGIVVAPPPPPGTPPPTIGGLDSGFGSGGIVRQTTGLSTTTAVTQQSDGKTLAVGDVDTPNGSDAFGISRFNADGSLDTTYGQTTVNGVTMPGTGTVVTGFGGDDTPIAVIIQPDGKALVAGTSAVIGNPSASRFALARYNPDGSLDTTFGNGGRVLTSFGAPNPNAPPGAAPPFADVAEAMLLLPNGQIVVAGHSNALGTQDFALAQYNADGSPDTSYGSNGRVLTDFLGGADSGNAIALDPHNGDVIAAGSATNPTTGQVEFALAAYRPNGALDPTFGQGGKVLTSIGGQDDEAYGVAVNSLGYVAATGATYTTAADGTVNSSVATVMYTPAGTLDRHFGGRGIVTTSLSQPGVANQVEFNTNGSLLVAGGTVASLTNVAANDIDVALVQYTAAGALDSTFASGKPLVLNFSGTASAAAPVPSPVATTSAPTVGGSISGEAEDALALLSHQRAIVQALGELVVVAASGSETAVAEVVSTGASLSDSIQMAGPDSVITGTKGSASVTVSNAGDEAATGTVTITLYASLDESVGSGDTLLANTSKAKLSLKSSAAKVFKFKFQFPSSLSDGDYYILAEIAPTISETELDTTNDVAHSSSPVAVAVPLVDLTGPALSTPTGLTPGSMTTLPFTIKNDGNVAAKETVSVQALAAAGATPGTGDVTLATSTLKLQLKVGASSADKLRLTLPTSLPSGTYYLLVVLTGSNGLDDILAGTDPLVVNS
jgi:uncharacterized delta-60 repeat protein